MDPFSMNHNLIFFILPGSYVEHVNIPPAVITIATEERCSIFKMLIQDDQRIRSNASGTTSPLRCSFRKQQQWVFFGTKFKLYFLVVKVHFLLQVTYAPSN